jgi:membrane protease YdiL (CAAX protease family)
MKKAIKVSGEILIYIGIYLVLQILLTVILGIFYGIWAAIENKVLDPAELQTLLSQSTLYVLIGSMLFSLLGYIVLFKAKKEDLIQSCNFSVIRKSDTGLAILLGITFNFTLITIKEATSLYKLFPSHEKLIEQLIGGDFWLTLIIVGITAPIFEEILFRGIIFNQLCKYIPLNMAILIQGLIFGIYHQNLLQGIYSTILGIFAGLLYYWFNSIWAPIFVHISFNTLSVIMSRVANQSFLFSYWREILISSSLVMILTLYLLWRNRTRTVRIEQKA